MYTHSLWGTAGRREHLNSTKKFWCKCERCEDPTEFGKYINKHIFNLFTQRLNLKIKVSSIRYIL